MTQELGVCRDAEELNNNKKFGKIAITIWKFLEYTRVSNSIDVEDRQATL